MIPGLNKAYEVEEKRLWWRVLFIMFALTISLSTLGLTALVAIAYGNRVGIFIRQHLETRVPPVNLISQGVNYLA